MNIEERANRAGFIVNGLGTFNKDEVRPVATKLYEVTMRFRGETTSNIEAVKALRMADSTLSLKEAVDMVHDNLSANGLFTTLSEVFAYIDHVNDALAGQHGIELVIEGMREVVRDF